MKRYISLFLILTLTVCMIATPVNAAESSIGYVDLMEYGGIMYNDELYEDFKFTPTEEGQGYFEFPVGLPFAPGYIELLIFTGADLTLYNNSIYQYELDQRTSIISDPADRYKVYIGNIRGTLQEEDTFRIYFNYAVGDYTPEIRILSAKILPYNYEPIAIPMGYQFTESVTGDFNTEDEVYTFQIWNDAVTSGHNRFNVELNIYFSPDYIMGMDYIDLTVFAQNLQITSLSAQINGIVLPVEYSTSFLGDGVVGWVTSVSDFSEFTAGIYRSVIRIDVSGLSTLYPGDFPILNICYTSSTYQSLDPVFAVESVIVGKLWTQPDPQVSWLAKIFNVVDYWLPFISTWVRTLDLHLTSYFTSLNTWIDNQTSSIVAAIKNDDYNDDEGFNSAVQEEMDELDQMQAVMDSVQRPDLDSVNVSVDQYVSQADVVTLTSPFTVLLTGNVFGPIVIMTILFATVSYVLYGKR